MDPNSTELLDLDPYRYSEYGSRPGSIHEKYGTVPINRTSECISKYTLFYTHCPGHNLHGNA
jgi:hypothetical protein